MATTRANRGLATLAVLHLSKRELRAFHELISEMSGTLFVETVRGLEDEFENSISVILEQLNEQSCSALKFSNLYRDLDRIRKTELGITVVEFADALPESIAKCVANDRSDVPKFDSRCGLQAWIKNLVKRYSEAVVFHAAMSVKHDRNRGISSDWKL